NESVFIDGKTLTITQGTSKGDVAAQTTKLGARDLGPGAIIFRSGDKLYFVDAPPPQLYALNDRQQSYGGLNDDRQRSYGGLNDRQQAYAGPHGRQKAYGGLTHAAISDRHGVLADMAAERQR